MRTYKLTNEHQCTETIFKFTVTSEMTHEQDKYPLQVNMRENPDGRTYKVRVFCMNLMIGDLDTVRKPCPTIALAYGIFFLDNPVEYDDFLKENAKPD